jgi:hypothetical protein
LIQTGKLVLRSNSVSLQFVSSRGKVAARFLALWLRAFISGRTLHSKKELGSVVIATELVGT